MEESKEIGDSFTNKLTGCCDFIQFYKFPLRVNRREAIPAKFFDKVYELSVLLVEIIIINND